MRFHFRTRDEALPQAKMLEQPCRPRPRIHKHEKYDWWYLELPV